MSLKDYYDQTKVDDDITTINIDGVNINVIILDGIIYRGDTHNNTLLRNSPAYFGDYKSSAKYLSKDSYLKLYTTKQPIKLLCLNNNKDNIIKLKALFKDVLSLKFGKRSLVTFILLQISYGIISGNSFNIDLIELSISIILQTLKRKMNLPKENVSDINTILTNYVKDSKIRPSRCSMREVDKCIVHNLRIMLDKYQIGGIWFSNKFVYSDDPSNISLCVKVNKDIYDKESTRLTCVPSEINIFNPSKSLNIKKIIHILKKPEKN
jgi:hypothetical protein